MCAADRNVENGDQNEQDDVDQRLNVPGGAVWVTLPSRKLPNPVAIPVLSG